MLRNSLYKPWFVGDTEWGFEIIDGMYSDVVIQIESLDFASETSGEVELNFHVIKKPDIFDDDLSKDPVFKSQVELILNDILLEATEIYKDEPHRDSNT